MTESYTTDHYVFHYCKGSSAEKDIQAIARTQEESFAKICATLRVSYPGRIQYYFTDSPHAVGRAVWNEDFRCNGVALCGRNKIYAVYTEQVKCIGAHEDAHLISFLINFPDSDFVVEGLAMFFDGQWWGVANELWASYYKAVRPALSVKELLDNDAFAKIGDVVGYPIAGAFTAFLMATFGMERYLAFYKRKWDDCEELFYSAFGLPLAEIEALFWEKMGSVSFHAPSLEKMLKDNGF